MTEEVNEHNRENNRKALSNIEIGNFINSNRIFQIKNIFA